MKIKQHVHCSICGRDDWYTIRCGYCDEEIEVPNPTLNTAREIRKTIDDLIEALNQFAPEKPSHICGSPEALCDANCIDYANYWNLMERARKTAQKIDQLTANET